MELIVEIQLKQLEPGFKPNELHGPIFALLAVTLKDYITIIFDRSYAFRSIAAGINWCELVKYYFLRCLP